MNDQQLFNGIHEVVKHEACPLCDEQGKTEEIVTCNDCKGSGKQVGYNFRCGTCHGIGSIIAHKTCSMCHGKGTIDVQRRVYNKIFADDRIAPKHTPSPQKKATTSSVIRRLQAPPNNR